MATFQPPTYRQRPDTGVRLIDAWTKITRGYTVLKNPDGTYSTYPGIIYPTQDQLAAAAFVYMGGHVYTISAAEATALTNAGYGSFIT